MKDKFDKIFTSSDCISHENMQKYLAKKLSKQELQVAEKHLVDCEMCKDELEGLKLLTNQNLSKIVTEINSKIDSKIENKKSIFLDYRFQAVAASFLIIVSISIFYLNININKTTKQEIAQISKQIEKETKYLSSDSPTLAQNSRVSEDVSKKSREESIQVDKVLKKSIQLEPKFFKSESNFDKKENSNLDLSISAEDDDLSTKSLKDVDSDEKQFQQITREESPVAGYAMAKTPANNGLLKQEQKTKNEIVTRETTTFADKPANEEIMEMQTIAATSKRAKTSKAKETTVAQVASANSIENISNFDLGMEQFNAKNFKSAIYYFEKSSETETYKSIFYCGLSYYNLSDYKIALTYFEKIEHEKFNENYNETQWYLANCYVKTNNNSKAYLILNKISTSNSEFKNQAIELLKTLE